MHTYKCKVRYAVSKSHTHTHCVWAHILFLPDRQSANHNYTLNHTYTCVLASTNTHTYTHTFRNVWKTYVECMTWALSELTLYLSLSSPCVPRSHSYRLNVPQSHISSPLAFCFFLSFPLALCELFALSLIGQSFSQTSLSLLALLL